MSEIEVPKGWSSISLDNKKYFFNMVGGGTPSRQISSYYGDEIPWVRLGDMRQKYIYDTSEKLSLEGLKKLGAKIIPKNAIILSTRATIGKVAIAGKDLTTNQGFKSIVCNEEKILPEFLYYYFKSITSYLQSKAKTTTFPEINKTALMSLVIPIPDIETQKKIVKKLEVILNKLEEKKKIIYSFNHYKKLKNAKKFMNQQIYDNVFLNVEPDWISKTLGELIIKSQNGKTGRPNDSSGVARLGISCITQNDSGFIDETKCRFQKLTSLDINTYQIKNGDLLVCRQNGNKSSVGKFSVYAGNTAPLIFSDSLIRFQVKTDEILPEFLMMFMNSSLGRKQINPFCKTTAGNYSINGANLKSIKIPFPSILKQKKSIKSKTHQLQQIENTSNRIIQFLKLKEKTLFSIMHLEHTILDSAFSGKILN